MDTTAFANAPSLKHFEITGSILEATARAQEIMDRYVEEAADRQQEFDRQVTLITCPKCGRRPLILRRLSLIHI